MKNMHRPAVLFAAYFLVLAGVAHAQSPAVPAASNSTPDGSILALGTSCYTLTSIKDAAGKDQTAEPIGLVYQSIQATKADGVDALAIVVHQSVPSLKFELRDSLLVRKADLLPIHLDTDRNGAPHVHLDYAHGRVTGWKMVKGVKQPINVALDGPVWDGNLWGVTFAALPLQPGTSYKVPTYQYDNGMGALYVQVMGLDKVATPRGPEDAWVLDVGLKPDEPVAHYLVGRKMRMELGNTAGPMAQRLGGECGDLH